MTNEVDYNHPDHPDQKLKRMLKEIQSATSIEVDTTGALIIYMANESKYPPGKWAAHMGSVKDAFKEIFPDIKILVTGYKMEFTTITKKQVFSEKLTGNI